MSFANDLHVIVPVPSYNSNINIPFPDFVSLAWLVNILPSNVTLPSFAVISCIFTFFSFAFDGFPIIYCCSSSSSGIISSAGMYCGGSSGSGISCGGMSEGGIYPFMSVGILFSVVLFSCSVFCSFCILSAITCALCISSSSFFLIFS